MDVLGGSMYDSCTDFWKKEGSFTWGMDNS